MPAQPYHHGDLRRTLLEAASASLERTGVEALSLRQLSRDAGVSHAAPSRHFRDKQALLDALAEDGFHRLATVLKDLVRIPAASPEDARAQFDALAIGYVEFARAHPTLLTLMFGMKHAPDARPELIAAGHETMEITAGVVVALQNAGAIRSGDAGEIALTIFATVHGVATLTVGGFVDPLTAHTLLARACDALWAGLQ